MKIVVADKLDPEVLDEIKNTWETVYLPENLEKALVDADALVIRSRTKVTEELLSKAKSLKVVVRAGVGLDNVDLEECKTRGIKVANTPEASAISVAEITLTLMLSMLHKASLGYLKMKQGKWEKRSLIGNELYGKTVGIIGFGRIGSRVAGLCKAFGAKVIVVHTHEVKGFEQVSLEECLKQCDVLSLHVPLTEKTRGMIGGKEISLMKDGAWIVNTARGAEVDEEALYNALKSGKLGGAAFDIYWEEPYSGKLVGLDNFVCFPHLGVNNKEAMQRVGEELINRLHELLE